MEKLCAGAYVIFEHRRSRDRALVRAERMALCLATAHSLTHSFTDSLAHSPFLLACLTLQRDYQLYSNHLPPFVKPPPALLFRGTHRLIVTEAPPPSDIVYENLEASAASRAVRQVFTNLVTILLLVLALVLVVTLRRVSDGYAEGADLNTGVCDALGDQVYGGAPSLAGAGAGGEGSVAATPWYHLPPGNGLSPCDPGSHYLSFFPPGAIDGATAAAAETGDGCVNPCFDAHDKAAMQVYQTCPSGLELRRGDLVKCFCIARFGQMATTTAATASTTTAAAASVQAAEWATASYEQMQDEGVLDLCMSPAWAFFVSQVVSAIASIVTNVVNELIRLLLPYPRAE